MFTNVSLLQQLMRERQQMASRPFASVAVALDVGGTEVELLQGGIEVSLTSHLCVFSQLCFTLLQYCSVSLAI